MPLLCLGRINFREKVSCSASLVSQVSTLQLFSLPECLVVVYANEALRARAYAPLAKWLYADDPPRPYDAYEPWPREEELDV